MNSVMANPETTSLRMAEALLGSLKNGCEINARDLEILIEAMKRDYLRLQERP